MFEWCADIWKKREKKIAQNSEHTYGKHTQTQTHTRPISCLRFFLLVLIYFDGWWHSQGISHRASGFSMAHLNSGITRDRRHCDDFVYSLLMLCHSFYSYKKVKMHLNGERQNLNAHAFYYRYWSITLQYWCSHASPINDNGDL